MFFDTNIIIKYLNNELEEELLKVFKLNIIKKKALVSHIVISEVLAFSGYTEIETKNIEKFLYENLKIVNSTRKIAVLAASIIKTQKLQTGKRFKLTDAIIAATAIAYNYEFLTFDKEDFKNIENLKLFHK